jgi:hypothetical protein
MGLEIAFLVERKLNQLQYQDRISPDLEVKRKERKRVYSTTLILHK